MYTGGVRKKITNRIRKKYDEYNVLRRPREMLPYANGSILASSRFGDCCGRSHASFPRRRTLRKIKNAATAKIGAMNRDTAAPSGMSFPEIAKLNAHVAKTWV